MCVDVSIPQLDMNVKNMDVESDLIDVSSRESFHLISLSMHYSLYPDFFYESTTQIVVLNHFDYFFVGLSYDQVQGADVSQLKDENN